jgi:hypothetical protein
MADKDCATPSPRDRRWRDWIRRWPLRQMLLLPLALSPCLAAVSATVPLSEYQKQEWQVEDGLPQSELRAITQIPGGRLLIATYGGVASFDGLRFSPIHVDATDPAASEAVNSLLVSRGGFAASSRTRTARSGRPHTME